MFSELYWLGAVLLGLGVLVVAKGAGKGLVGGRDGAGGIAIKGRSYRLGDAGERYLLPMEHAVSVDKRRRHGLPAPSSPDSGPVSGSSSASGTADDSPSCGTTLSGAG